MNHDDVMAAYEARHPIGSHRDIYLRPQALDQALKFYGEQRVKASDVVQVAEIFLDFLLGRER